MVNGHVTTTIKKKDDCVTVLMWKTMGEKEGVVVIISTMETVGEREGVVLFGKSKK